MPFAIYSPPTPFHMVRPTICPPFLSPTVTVCVLLHLVRCLRTLLTRRLLYRRFRRDLHCGVTLHLPLQRTRLKRARFTCRVLTLRAVLFVLDRCCLGYASTVCTRLPLPTHYLPHPPTRHWRASATTVRGRTLFWFCSGLFVATPALDGLYHGSRITWRRRYKRLLRVSRFVLPVDSRHRRGRRHSATTALHAALARSLTPLPHWRA